MKLIIQQYLASLKERDELDAILPDLLRQIGLNVISTPGRGTRQDGVDIAAVGKAPDSTEEKVYLFSIKAGDLTRSDWNSDSPQALRPSLDEIIDAYIPTKLPSEHKSKPIVICLCMGGEVKEQIQTSVTGYTDKNTNESLSYETWHGDKLADLIQIHFLREELFKDPSRSYLRKSLALIDEPDSSYKHFRSLLGCLSDVKEGNAKDTLTALRQINICLWIQFSWARDEKNIESSYLCAELALLYAWQLTKTYTGQKKKITLAIQATFCSILNIYHQVSTSFVEEKLIPQTSKKHALSSSIGSNNDLDVNLRLFDCLGRLSIAGLWLYTMILNNSEVDDQQKQSAAIEIEKHVQSIVQMVLNNPALLMPIKDDQAIDLTLAVSLLLVTSGQETFARNWLHEIINRAHFSLETHGKYPCTIRTYSELLDHPTATQEYLKNKTAGSILYPMIGIFAAILGDESLFAKIQNLKSNILAHCNFQLWFPDEISEEHIYLNSENHGAALSGINVNQTLQNFADQIFGECENSDDFYELSATQCGVQSLVMVACRHYRLPIPIHPLRGLRAKTKNADDAESPPQETN